MSKRLRASMRAANKGRNLRPRASQPHAPVDMPSEPPAPEEAIAELLTGPASQDGGDLETPEDAVPEQAETVANSDARAQVTVREPAVANAGQHEDHAEPAPAVEPVSVDPLSTTRPSEPMPFALGKAEEVQLLTKVIAPAPRPATVEEHSAPAASTEPAKAETHPLTTTAREEAPQRKKIEEPKKSLPGKAEEAPRSASSKKQAKHAKKDPEPESRRPAEKTFDEELDQSSISAEFFRKDQDSVPPVEEIEEEIGKPVVVLSPTTLARRARLRRWVAGVVAFAGVISIAVVGKTVMASKKPVAPMPAMVTTEIKPTNVETKPAVEVQKPAEEKKVEPPKTEPPKAEEQKADAPPKADEKKDEAKKEEPKAEEAKKEEPKALTKEAESLLNRGKRKEAMEKAREAIAADPTQAMPYLLLGSALQDSGKWKEGIEAYSECVRNATKGAVNECRAMGGHK